jgi:hypothetical protein
MKSVASRAGLIFNGWQKTELYITITARASNPTCTRTWQVYYLEIAHEISSYFAFILNLKYINYEGVKRLHLGKDIAQCRVFVKMVTNFQVP